MTTDHPINSKTKGPDKPDPARRRHQLVGWLGCGLGIAIGVGGLILGRLAYLWIAFDVFSQFALQFAFLVLAFVLALAIPRFKVLAACLIFITMVVAYGLWPFVQQPDATQQGATNSGAGSVIKVAQFNTWMENQTPEAVITEVGRLDADIVTLVEFGPNKRKLLPQLKAQYPYRAECNDEPMCNFAILAKFPIAHFDTKLSWKGPPLMHAVMGGPLAGLNVFAVHTTRFPHSRAQFTQMKALSELIQTVAGPKLVMGDFNATPLSRILQVMTNETGLTRLTDLPTWPAWAGLPQLAIDHVFVTPGLNAVEREQLGNGSGSDHFPITFKIVVPAATATN